MKLLYIHQYFKFPDQSGGTRSYDLATALVKRGVQLIVISSNPNPTAGTERWQEFDRDGIHFYMMNCAYNNRMGFAKRIGAFLAFMYHASLKVLEVKCDIVLATSTPLTIAIPALVRRWVKKTPFVFEIRDVWPDVPIKMGFIKNKLAIKLLYWFEILIYRQASWLVPLSEGMNANIQQRYPNNKYSIIPNISELSRFAQPTQKSPLPLGTTNKKIILYAGTLGNVNGLRYVVDLASHTQLIDDSVVYLIYGDGIEKNDVIDYAQKKGVLNRTFFYGGVVSKSELPFLYSVCTMGSSFVIDNPVLWDNSANKFFDTLAAGKPILINHLGWQAEVINKNSIGYVLPPSPSSDVAQKFIAYVNSDDVRTQGISARALAEREYSLEIAVKRYMEIIERIS